MQRVVDEPFGPKSRANIPGVEDLHAELAAYADAMAANMTEDVAAAAARQRRTTAAELGLAAVDALDDVASIPARITFLNSLAEEVGAGCALPGAHCACRSEVVDWCALPAPSLPALHAGLAPGGYPGLLHHHHGGGPGGGAAGAAALAAVSHRARGLQVLREPCRNAGAALCSWLIGKLHG